MTLQQFFKKFPKAALAFSGGTDSAYLLFAAIHAGCDVHAYYVKSDFQPQFELEDALRLAKLTGAKLSILRVDILADPVIRENPSDRCYHCKKKIFDAIFTAARADGYELLMDGTNASDDVGDRPGMKALAELEVRSPLRECGITKSEVRQRSREAGLFTWDKPAYACLATRIPAGEEITAKKLSTTETCEKALKDLGFTDFRIRTVHGAAKIQIREEQFEKLILYRTQILEELKPYYTSVTLDLEVRS